MTLWGAFLLQKICICDPNQQFSHLPVCPLPQTQSLISLEICLLLPLFEQDGLNVCAKSKVNDKTSPENMLLERPRAPAPVTAEILAGFSF